MERPKFQTVDGYIASFPPEHQRALEELRKEVRAVLPGAEEAISYGIPAFKLDGRYVVYIAGYKTHTSIYPAPRGVPGFEELAAYKGGKGTVQFPLGKPLPLALVRRIVAFRLEEASRRR